MKKLIIFKLFLLVATLSFAQSSNEYSFRKLYNIGEDNENISKGNDIIEIFNEGFIIVGNYSIRTDNFGFICKINYKGDTLWSKLIAKTNLNSIILKNDSNLLIAGSYEVIVNDTIKTNGPLILNIDKNGKILNKNVCPFPIDSNFIVNNIKKLDSNNYLIGGSCFKTSESLNDSQKYAPCIILFNTLNSTFKYFHFSTLTYGFEINDFVIDENKNIFVAGGLMPYKDIKKEKSPAVLKLDSNFNILWMKAYFAGDGYEYFPPYFASPNLHSISINNNNTLSLFGIYNGLNNGVGSLLLTINQDGLLVFEKVIQLKRNQNEFSSAEFKYFKALKLESSNDYYVLGGTKTYNPISKYNDYFFTKINFWGDTSFMYFFNEDKFNSNDFIICDIERVSGTLTESSGLIAIGSIIFNEGYFKPFVQYFDSTSIKNIEINSKLNIKYRNIESENSRSLIVNNTLTINRSKKSILLPSSLYIFNQLGEKIFESELFPNEKTIEIDVSKLPKGIYFVNELTNSNKVIYSKFIKL